MAPPPFNRDFDDMLGALLGAKVDFVIVGAWALAAHGEPRATGDIDVLVRPSRLNAKRVMKALGDFGAPTDAHGATQQDFERPGLVYQIGLPPRRIDLLTSITGVGYDEALVDAVIAKLGSHTVRFIGRAALITNKLATGRTKDRADVELLNAATKPSPKPGRGKRKK